MKKVSRLNSPHTSQLVIGFAFRLDLFYTPATVSSCDHAQCIEAAIVEETVNEYSILTGLLDRLPLGFVYSINPQGPSVETGMLYVEYVADHHSVPTPAVLSAKDITRLTAVLKEHFEPVNHLLQWDQSLLWAKLDTV